jgi:ribonuclease D
MTAVARSTVDGADGSSDIESDTESHSTDTFYKYLLLAQIDDNNIHFYAHFDYVHHMNNNLSFMRTISRYNNNEIPLNLSSLGHAKHVVYPP